MQIRSVGIDLGKTTFHLVALSAAGKVLLRKKFTQKQLVIFTANMQTSLIGMEACSGAHFLGRVLREQGHDVKRVRVLQDLRHRLLQLERSLGEDHATLQQEGPQLVDHRRAASDEPIAYAMHRLQVQLVLGLDRHEAHVLPVHRFGDRLSIQEVVLVRLHERLYELSWNQLHIVAL